MYDQAYLTQGRLLEGHTILAFAGAGSPAAPRPAPQGGAAGSAPLLILRAEAGSLTGRQIPVSGSPFTVGRNPDNSLVLAEAQVSRYHARLERREGRWFLEDLNSANGTFVNRQQLSPHQAAPLGSGDLIGIGESVFTVQLQMPSRPAAPPPGAARPAAKPKRSSPWVAIIVGLVLVAVVAAVVWMLVQQIGQEEEVAPAPALPTISLPTITIPTVQIPTITLPTIEMPTNLPIPTPAADLLAPVQTALPELKLPIKTPAP